MTRPMVGERMSTWMEQSMLGIGKRINSMVMVLRLGLMQQNTKEITNLARNTVLEHSSGLMDLHTLENSIIIIYTEKEFTHGLIIESMKVNGGPTKCMERELLHGLITEDILVNTQMIRKEDTENSYGRMEDVTGANGLMENSMVREHM